MTASVQTYYRPGLIFKAHEKARAHQECCYKGAEEVRNADGTLRIEEHRALWAEFGVYGAEYNWEDEATGLTGSSATIRGGFFDLDSQAAEKNWTDVEKEIVARHMVKLAESGKAQFALYSKQPAAKPWPKYDDAHHSKVAAFADDFGCLAEALTYETENKNRPSVVSDLNDRLVKAQTATVSEDALTAA